MKKLIVGIPIILFSAFLILNFINIFITPVFLFSKVHSNVVIEAGENVPAIEAFLTNRKQIGTFTTDMSKINTHGIGETPILIDIHGKQYSSVLTIEDTTPPSASPLVRYVVKGDYLEASDFITDILDATQVSAKFNNQVDFSVSGWQIAIIELKDEGENSALVTSSVYVYDIMPNMEIEAGTKPDKIYPQDFIYNNITDNPVLIEFDSDVNSFDFSKPTVYEVDILIDGRKAAAKITVADTIPPECTVTPFTCALNNHVPADKFVKDIADATAVTVSYKTPPDFTMEGFQSVTIVLTDEAGNSTEKKSWLTVMEDNEPPVIEGETDKVVKIGSNVIYRANVTVSDNCDDIIPLEVDSSAVNLKKAGIYPVIYSATDTSGNTIAVKGSLTVMEVGMDEVLEMADEIIAKIITEDMTLEQKVRAVYNWIIFHVSYKNTDEKYSLVLGGYNAFKLGKGDCYTYYSAAEILLTRLGIDNMLITRLGGYTRHYWNLVNIGDGWYHFDSCPRTVYMDGCMFTDTVAEEFTAFRGGNYYTYDKSLYPEVVK